MELADEVEFDESVRSVLGENRIEEVHRIIAEYRCYRTRADGDSQVVCIRVLDMGPEHPRSRYSWRVWTPGAENAEPLCGNCADSVHRAGANVHWRDLDAPDRRDLV